MIEFCRPLTSELRLLHGRFPVAATHCDQGFPEVPAGNAVQDEVDTEVRIEQHVEIMLQDDYLHIVLDSLRKKKKEAV